MKRKSRITRRTSGPASEPAMCSSRPDGVTKVIEPNTQLRAMARSPAQNAAGAPFSSGSRRKARRSQASAASEGPNEGLWARLMFASPEMLTAKTYHEQRHRREPAEFQRDGRRAADLRLVKPSGARHLAGDPIFGTRPHMTTPNALIEIKTGAGPVVRIGNAERLSIIAGPCQLESRQHALETAHALKEMAR